MVIVEPLFTLMAAPSKSLFVSSVDASSRSESVLLPIRVRVTVLDFFTTTGAVVEEERVRSLKISVTSSRLFATEMEPSLQLPVTV